VFFIHCYTFLCLGHKEGHPARAYNCTVNHRRICLHATGGHPCTFSDKTLVKSDAFISGLQEGRLLTDRVFHLYAWDGETVIKQKWKGVYLLADNGYIPYWSTTMPPHTNPGHQKEQALFPSHPTHLPRPRVLLFASHTRCAFSEHLESTRKDSECFFGILKVIICFH